MPPHACCRKFDERILIQSLWNDTTSTKQSAVAVFQGVYSIELYHSIDVGQPSCSLQFMSDTMPLQSIVAPDISCCAQHLPGSPFSVKVKPSSPCATLSVITTTTSLWTAGSVCIVEITTKDLYGNFLDTWDNRWHVFMASTNPVASKEFSRVPVMEGKTQVPLLLCHSTYFFVGTVHWRFTATPTTSARYKVQAMLLGASAGLAATVYSSIGGGILSSAVAGSHDDVRKGLQLGNISQFYALYSGYFYSSQRGIYTLQLLKHSPLNETIRLTIAGSTTVQIVDGEKCTSNSSANCEITATCVLESPGNLYDVKVEYFRNDPSMLGGNFTLNFRFYNSSYLNMMPHIFPLLGFKGDGFDVLVLPATPHAVSSVASGNCLTIATAGTACQFTIAIRDEFGSSSILTSNISILCSSFVDTSSVLGQVVSIDGSVFRVTYVPSLSGYHTLSVFIQQATLQWALLVTPASLAAAQNSFVKGSALSVSTAGSDSKFTIFAMDSYGNVLESVRNVAVTVESEAKSEYHALTVDSNRAINTMVFKDMTASYRISKSGRYWVSVAALDAGLTMLIGTESLIKDSSIPPVYLTTSSDVSLQSYHALSRDFFQRSNTTLSRISFSGFISAATSGVFTFKVLTSSTSDVVILNIDRIKLINSNATSDAIANSYILSSLDSAPLHDAVVKLNWPESSDQLISNAIELWSPPSTAFTISSAHGSCTNQAGAMIDGNGGWCASGGIGSTMTIDLGATKQIVGVATQGRSDNDQWVTGFEIQTSNDGSAWSSSGSFPGNTDRNTIVSTYIVPSANARYVRIKINAFYGYCSMRAGVLLKPSVLDTVTNSMIFAGNVHTDAGPHTWNIHTSGFSITTAFMVTALASDETLIHLFNVPGDLKHNIILELSLGSAFNIRFLIFNEAGDDINSGCITSDQPLRALNTKYTVTAVYDVVLKVSKIYVNGLLRKTCIPGANAAAGPRTLQFSRVGQASSIIMAKYFKGKMFNLAIYDRSLNAEEVAYHHQALKGHVFVATIALVESTLYEFQLNYSAINFSRVGLMVCSIHDVFAQSFGCENLPLRCYTCAVVFLFAHFHAVVVGWRLHRCSCFVILQVTVSLSWQPVFCCRISRSNLRIAFDRFRHWHIPGHCRSGIDVLHSGP